MKIILHLDAIMKYKKFTGDILSLIDKRTYIHVNGVYNTALSTRDFIRTGRQLEFYDIFIKISDINPVWVEIIFIDLGYKTTVTDKTFKKLYSSYIYELEDKHRVDNVNIHDIYNCVKCWNEYQTRQYGHDNIKARCHFCDDLFCTVFQTHLVCNYHLNYLLREKEDIQRDLCPECASAYADSDINCKCCFCPKDPFYQTKWKAKVYHGNVAHLVCEKHAR
jgi:hypothetical protein